MNHSTFNTVNKCRHPTENVIPYEKLIVWWFSTLVKTKNEIPVYRDLFVETDGHGNV